MRLKRLLCRGFKSFADRTEFDFDSPLTGIIGPNGCGKSNVVDALKWVLGDQRARSLRGKEMTDVIFKGAEGRDSMSHAEVEITLEDENGLFDGRTEMRVGRRLSTEKESEYQLNGENVRLKDVRSAMMDTGLGVGAYSVMEQGRIDAVLSANPEERRAIFEEAAGISRFKLQKRETLRKLDRTEQNLARVVDLLEERGRRIRSLKIQAGKARRYAELRSELRDWKSSVAVHDAGQLTEDRAGRAAELASRQAELAAAEKQHDEAVSGLAEIEVQLTQGADALEQVQDRLRELRGQIDNANTRANALDERRRDQLAEVGECESRSGELHTQREERAAAIVVDEQRLADLVTEEATLQSHLAELAKDLSARQQEFELRQSEREAARRRVLEWIHKQTQARNRAHAEEAEIRALAAREQRLRERRGVLDGDVGTLDREFEQATESLADVRARLAAERAAEEAEHDELATADEQAAELARRESSLREQLSAATGQIQVLQEMESHMEGLDQGPRHLLESHPVGLRGRLLDLLDVDVEYGRALEAALGPLVQALVVDQMGHAEAMLAELTEGRHGRATLVVEEAFREAWQSSPADAPAGSKWLWTVVRCDSAVQPMVRWLLRNACLVPQLPDIQNARADLCYVTPEGELLREPRIEGGRGEHQGGLVVRKAQLQHLRQQAAELRTQLDELVDGQRVVADRLAAIKARVREIGAACDGLRASEHELLGDSRRLSGRVEDLRREREALDLELVEIRRQRGGALAWLGEHLLNVFLLKRCEQRETAVEEARAVATEEAQDSVRAAQQAEQDARMRQVANTTDREGLTATLRVHRQHLTDLDRTAAELGLRMGQLRSAAAAAEEESGACRQQTATLRMELADLEAERDSRSEVLEEARRERDAGREVLGEIEARRSELSESITALRLDLSELDHRFTRLEDRLREDTGIELRRCLGEIEGFGLTVRDGYGPPAPAEVPVLAGPALPASVWQEHQSLDRKWQRDDFDPAEARRMAQILQSKVDRLGHVNLDAVRELEEMTTSFQFLEQEVEDLKESRKSLIETLRRLETESRSLFETTFEQARQNFQTIFRKLFQGGRADMFLSSADDALESGIDIVARPPGKQLQSINLLSGGERSLTALAILFAVFKVKPSPFCILDEVDAALDDTNVERFLRVLRDFVGPTQFCIVTHHKRTMAECRRLYGITMQKRGVSTRMAVELDQVDSFAESANAVSPVAQRIAGEERVGF